MKITLKLQGATDELNVNLTNKAGRIYRQVYKRDMLQDMQTIYKRQNKSPFDDIDMSGITLDGKSEQEIYQQLMSKVDVSKLIQARENSTLDFAETEMGGHIIWACVKNADNNVKDYEDWIDSYDYILPVGKIVSALYEAWADSAMPTVELKN